MKSCELQPKNMTMSYYMVQPKLCI
jgi:hypothetical protein